MNNSNHYKKANARLMRALMASLLLFSANAFAQNPWINPAGGSWTTGANWQQGAAPNAVDAIADFSQAAVSVDTTVHLDASQAAGYLIFGNATAANWTLDNNGNAANVLTLATSSGTPSIIVTNMATIGATLAGNQGLAIGGSGAGTLVISSGAYSGLTTISNETVVLGAGNVLSTNDLWFGGSAVSNGAVATLILGGSGQTVSNLVTSGTSSASGSTTAATIMVTNGQTLTVQGSALFGYLNASTVFTNNVKFTGGGSFAQHLAPGADPNTPLSFQVGACNLTSGQSGPRATVDMSGLSSAVINLGINTNAGTVYYPTGVGSLPATMAGSLIVGDAMKNNAGGELCSLLLASNTTVTANMLVLGYERVQGVVETLVLGAGSNVFNINTNAVAAPPGFSGREGGRMFFNTPTGSLKIRAKDGVSRSTLYVAASQAGPAGVNLSGFPFNSSGYGGMISAQYADLSGHYADLLLSTLVVGDEKRGNGTYAFPELWTNYFSFDTGILDTTGLRVGITTGTASGTNYYQSVCNLNGGRVVIGVNGITNASFPGISSTTTGFLYTNDTYLNIGGSVVTVNGNIMAGFQNNTNINAYLLSTIAITNGSLTVTGSVYCGRTTTTVTSVPISPRIVTLTLDGGLLDMTGHPIGSNPFGSTVTNNYVDVLNFKSGTLQNISQLNNGTVPLVKSGAGTLTLSGVNSYTGGTLVTNGTLVVNHDSALGSNDVIVASGATLQLGGGAANQYNNPGARLILSTGANPLNLAYVGSDRVAALSFDGGVTFQAAGTWGSSASSATHKDDAHFSGTGMIAVTVPATVALTSSASPVGYGQPVVLTATVSGASGTPTGTVTFSSGGTILGTATVLGDGTAAITNSALAGGTDSIIAAYSGDNTYTPSASSAFSQVVTVPPIAVSGSSLVLYYSNSIVGTNYVLTATTSLTPPVTWTPVLTNAGTGGVLTFTIPFSVTTPQQFFRYQLQ